MKKGKMKAKELKIYQDLSNDRINLKRSVLANDKTILNYMQKRGLDQVGDMTKNDFKRRIKQNEKYLQLAES